MAPIEDVVSGTTRSTTQAKPGSPKSRAYVTFLHGKGEGVTAVLRLAESLRKVNTAYPLVVAVLPQVPKERRRMLVDQGCTVREIQPVAVPKNQTPFTMTDNAINYSKLRIWGFVEYYKMIYLDGDTLVPENIDRLFDIPDGYFYAVVDNFREKTWSHPPKYQIGYYQQCPEKVQWPAELGPKASLYFNAGMFVFGPSLSVHDDLLDTLKDTRPTTFAQQVEKIKELELRAVDAEGKAAEAEKKLQYMDLTLKSLEQEIGSLKAEKEQLANAVSTSKDSLEYEIEAAKQKGCNEATAIYEMQFDNLAHMLFEDGWTSALDAANVPADSDLRKNVPYPRPENDVAEGAEARDT